MLLSHKATTVRAAPCRSRRSAVSVKAWAGDNSNPFAGLLRIFTPNKYINTKEDWENTGSGFKGKISRDRKPFKDGFINKLPKSEQVQEQEKADGPLGYLNDAAERVVGHNFKGDETEPDWSKQGHKGYSGDRRKKHGDDNFHSIKM